MATSQPNRAARIQQLIDGMPGSRYGRLVVRSLAGTHLFPNGKKVRVWLYGNFPNRWCAHGPGGTIIAGPGTIGFASPEEAAAALIEAGFTLSWCSGVKTGG